MTVTVSHLLAAEEAQRVDDMQMIARPRHGDVEKTSLLV